MDFMKKVIRELNKIAWVLEKSAEEITLPKTLVTITKLKNTMRGYGIAVGLAKKFLEKDLQEAFREAGAKRGWFDLSEEKQKELWDRFEEEIYPNIKPMVDLVKNVERGVKEKK